MNNSTYGFFFTLKLKNVHIWQIVKLNNFVHFSRSRDHVIADWLSIVFHCTFIKITLEYPVDFSLWGILPLFLILLTLLGINLTVWKQTNETKLMDIFIR